MVSPLGLDDGGVEVVVPSLPALLAEPAGDAPRQERPSLCAVLVDEAFEEAVLLLAPGLLLDARVVLGALLRHRLVELLQLYERLRFGGTPLYGLVSPRRRHLVHRAPRRTSRFATGAQFFCLNHCSKFELFGN